MNTKDESPESSLQQIAECAYYIWESEGRPAGREAEHWHQAELQLYLAMAHDAGLDNGLLHEPASSPAALAA
jgi:hypothetical protein